MTRAERAEAAFRDGDCCSEAVFTAFAAELGLDEGTARRIATAFCGGVGHLGELCGAVSGACMAIGLARGRAEPGDAGRKEETFRLVRRLEERFREAHGAVRCRDLLGYDIGDPDDHGRIVAEGLFETRCPGYVTAAVRLVEELLGID